MGCLLCGKYSMQWEDAVQAGRIHPAFIQVTGLKCSYGQKILEHLPTRDPGWKNGDLGNRASPPSHMNTSKIL